MAKMMKKITALVLAVMLCLGQTVLPVTAVENKTVKVDGVVVPNETHIPADSKEYTAEIKTETSYGPTDGPQVPVLDTDGKQIGTYDTTITGGTESTTNIENSHEDPVTVNPNVQAPDMSEFGEDKGEVKPGENNPSYDPSENGWNEEQGQWNKSESEYEAFENSDGKDVTFTEDGEPVLGNGGKPQTSTITDSEKIDVGILPKTDVDGEPVSENGELEFEPTVDVTVIEGTDVPGWDDEWELANGTTVDADGKEIKPNDFTFIQHKKQEIGDLPFFHASKITVVIDGKGYEFNLNTQSKEGNGHWIANGVVELGLTDGQKLTAMVYWTDENGVAKKCGIAMVNRVKSNPHNAAPGTDHYELDGDAQYQTEDVTIYDPDGDDDGYETEIPMESVVPEEYWEIATPVIDKGGNVIGWEVVLEQDPKPTSESSTDAKQTGSITYKYETMSVEDEDMDKVFEGKDYDDNGSMKVEVPGEGTSKTIYEKTVTQEPKKIQIGFNEDGTPKYELDENGEPVIATDAEGNALTTDVYTYTTTESTSQIVDDSGVTVSLTEEQKLAHLALMGITPEATEETYLALTAPDTSALPTADGSGNTLQYEAPIENRDPVTNELLSYTLKTIAYDADGRIAYTHEETIHRTKKITEHYLVVDELTGLQVTFKKETTEVATTTQFDKSLVEATKTWGKEVTTTTTERVVHRYMAEGTDETIDNGRQVFEFNGELFPVNALENPADASAITHAGITLLNKVTTTSDGKTVNKTVDVAGVQQQVYNANVTVEIKNTFFGLGPKVAVLMDGSKEIGRFSLNEPENADEGSTVYTLNAELTNGVKFTVNITDPQTGEYTLLDDEVSGALNVAAIAGADLAFDLTFTASAPDYVHTIATTTSSSTQKMKGEEKINAERINTRNRTVTTVYETDGVPVITIQGEYAKGTKVTTMTERLWERVTYLFTPAEEEQLLPPPEDELPPPPPAPPAPPAPPVDGGVPMLMMIDDGPVPLVHEPEEAVEILDEEVPLADAPSTGDASIIWGIMGMMSLGGSSLLNKGSKKTRKGGKYLKK